MESCPFCLMAVNKIQTKKIYEDNRIIAVLDIAPASKGHVLIFPRKHHPSITVMSEDEISAMFNVANKITISILKSLKAKGVNIFLADGQTAGQKIDHVILHIIPRYDNDQINFEWNPKKVSEQELNEVQKNILNNIPRENIEVKAEVKKIIFNEERRIP